MKTIINWELTDTFCGEANYSWVKRGTVESQEGEDFSDLAALAGDWPGCRESVT